MFIKQKKQALRITTMYKDQAKNTLSASNV